MISHRDIVRLLVAAMLVVASSAAVAQNSRAAGSVPNPSGQGRQGSLTRLEKQTTECLGRALQDMYAKGWRGASLTVAAMNLCPYPGSPVTVDDYAQLVHAQVAKSQPSE